MRRGQGQTLYSNAWLHERNFFCFSRIIAKPWREVVLRALGSPSLEAASPDLSSCSVQVVNEGPPGAPASGCCFGKWLYDFVKQRTIDHCFLKCS